MPRECLPPSAEVSLLDLRDRASAISAFMANFGTEAVHASMGDTVPDLVVGTACTVVHTALVDFEGFAICAFFIRLGRLASRGDGEIGLELDLVTCPRTSVLVGPPASRSRVIDGELARFAEMAAQDDGAPVLVATGEG